MEITIIRLTKENNKLNRIFDNYKFYKSFDYNKIQYISSDMTEGYTDDITKAKNFIKDNNQYYEVKRKDN